MMRIINKNKWGFTLIEMLLTIVIIGIMAGVAAKILLSGLDTYSFVVSRKDATQNARIAMDRIASEVLLLEEGDITFIANNRISFEDENGLSTSFQTQVSGNQTNITRGNDFLAGPLGFLDFDYLRADGADAAMISEIKKINIELSIDSQGGFGPVTFRTEVFPRNFMYEDFR